MSKRNVLQLFNIVLEKISDRPVTALTTSTALSIRQRQAFSNLSAAMAEIQNTNKGKWKFAEARGTITLATGTRAYPVATDLKNDNLESFYNEDNNIEVIFEDVDTFEDHFYPIDSSLNTGMPSAFTRFANNYEFNKFPTSTDNGKTVKYRYWKTDSTFNQAISTALSTQTCMIPEDFEETVLCNLAIHKQLKFEGDSEASGYYYEVYGNPQDKNKRGSMAEMIDTQNSSETSKARIRIK